MITLYTAPTPNGHKISIALEELELPYEVVPIDLAAGQQREPWYRAINPNARIPAIVDHELDDLPVFESGAILLHLAEKTGRLIGKDPRGRAETLSWLFFQVGGVGPMMGQANVFERYAPVRIEYAIERYRRECRRLFEVLEDRLQGRDWLAAGEYTIADIANYAWVRTHRWSRVDVSGLPRLKAWRDRIRSRPAVERGLAVPAVPPEDDVAAVGKKLLV